MFHLEQPAKGYRYNLDSMLLAKFASFKKEEVLCDLGCGVGVLAMLALERGLVCGAAAIEIQKDLFEYAKLNQNNLLLQKKLNLKQGDYKEIEKYFDKHSFDVVISNPPYRKKGSGKLSEHSQKIIAKHEVFMTMESLFQAAVYLMKKKGRFCVIYPSLRLSELLACASQFSLRLFRLQLIYPFIDSSANHVMAEFRFSFQGDPTIEKPFIVYDDPEHYSAEVEAWVGKKLKPKLEKKLL